jgi:hypothetical protein
MLFNHGNLGQGPGLAKGDRLSYWMVAAAPITALSPVGRGGRVAMGRRVPQSAASTGNNGRESSTGTRTNNAEAASVLSWVRASPGTVAQRFT